MLVGSVSAFVLLLVYSRFVGPVLLSGGRLGYFRMEYDRAVGSHLIGVRFGSFCLIEQIGGVLDPACSGNVGLGFARRWKGFSYGCRSFAIYCAMD